MSGNPERKLQWYLKNRERILAQKRAEYIPKSKLSVEQRKENRKESYTKYNQKPEAKHRFQAKQAARRGIEWQLPFETWWTIWQESGKWEERGQHAHQYCMCRKNDVGPYSIENVYIDTTSNNAKLVRALNK